MSDKMIKGLVRVTMLLLAATFAGLAVYGGDSPGFDYTGWRIGLSVYFGGLFLAALREDT